MTAKRAAVRQQNKGQAVGADNRQKKGCAEGRIRRPLGDIGNVLVTNKGLDGKRIIPNRPVTKRNSSSQFQDNPNFNAVKLKSKTKPLNGVAILAPGNPEPKAVKTQLHANAKANGAGQKNKKKSMEGAGILALRIPKPKVSLPGNPHKKVTAVNPTTPKKIIQKILVTEKPAKKTDYLNLTTILTARSKAAGGFTAKNSNPQIEDIDAGDAGNELAVVEYVEDIYKYYKEAEGKIEIEDYMEFQSHINKKMRAVLVDWLIETDMAFKLSKPTLYLTINLVDRFLATTIVRRRDLQLVGVGAMLLASKYEEIWAPLVFDFTSISEFNYTSEQILRMEKTILRRLDWTLTIPTPYVFLVRFIKACLCDQQLESLVFFLAELGMVQYETTRYRPSVFAASAVYAARHTLRKDPSWNPTLRKHTGYEEPELIECAKLLVKYHCLAMVKDCKLKAVYSKYSRSMRHKVALLPPAKSLMGFI